MLIASSQKLIGDDSIGFVFIHLPVPHPGGFYNRQTGAFSVPGSFLDNLALADRALRTTSRVDRRVEYGTGNDGDRVFRPFLEGWSMEGFTPVDTRGRGDITRPLRRTPGADGAVPE